MTEQPAPQPDYDAAPTIRLKPHQEPGQEQESVALLSRFAKGDDSALGALVDREGSRILRRLHRKMPGPLRARVGASDLYQVAAVDLMRFRDRFENQGIAAFRKLLGTMADHALARALERERTQKRSYEKERPLDAGTSSGGGPGQLPGEITTPSQQLMKGEQRDALRACFAELPEADQQILRLVDYGGLSYAQAAEKLGEREESLRKRHSRAVARLREAMKRHDV